MKRLPRLAIVFLFTFGLMPACVAQGIKNLGVYVGYAASTNP